MPEQEDEAKRLWEKLKSETDVSQDMKNATEEQKQNWQHQENDPGHVHGNAYTAAQQNEAQAKAEFSQQSFPSMSEAAKDQMMGSISNDLGSLTQQIEQSQALTQQQQR